MFSVFLNLNNYTWFSFQKLLYKQDILYTTPATARLHCVAKLLIITIFNNPLIVMSVIQLLLIAFQMLIFFLTTNLPCDAIVRQRGEKRFEQKHRTTLLRTKVD